MERGTLKTRAIFIATRGRTKLYHSFEEVPLSLRRKLLKSTAGADCGTVLIADRRGLQEILRTGIRQRLQAQPVPRPRRRPRRSPLLEFLAAHWTELALCCALALLLWLAFAARWGH